MRYVIFLVGLFVLFQLQAKSVSKYNVIWNSPSKDASGTMPIGNGDLAANVYAIENGDLYLLLSKNDAYNYCGDLLKTGRVKISLFPNPFTAKSRFRQELDLETASIYITSDELQIRVWADANKPVYHVTIESPQALQVSVTYDLWERFDRCVYNTFVSKGEEKSLPDYSPTTQDSIIPCKDGLMWLYNVGNKSVYQADLDYYGVSHLSHIYPDPFKYTIFGNFVKSKDLTVKEGKLDGKIRKTDITIYALTKQTVSPDIWIKKIRSMAEESLSLKNDWRQHCRWWKNFWERSWICATDNQLPFSEREIFCGEVIQGKRIEKDVPALISQNYQTFRYLMATQGRGSVPVKFNGGLFTQQLLVDKDDAVKRTGKKDTLSYGLLTHPDDRLWGRRFTFQNQRLLYWPLLSSGDFDLMPPFMDYYFNLLPHRKAVTKAWFGHEGAYFRENIEPTGMERDCGNTGKPLKATIGATAEHYHDFYFTSTLELLALMLQYAEFTGNLDFVQQRLLPYAREAILFFQLHYPKDKKGKLLLDPAMVLETFWKAKNPTPDISGLRYCLSNLLRLEYGTKADRETWHDLLQSIPEIPLLGQGKEAYILPAESYSIKKNAENGELYPVFPFNIYGKAWGNEYIVTNTMKKRTVKDAFGGMCWTQDQVDWAYAGDTLEVKKGLERRFRIASTQCRFPMFGRENPDSCPDFDHFGVGSIALQRMLVQESSEQILLFPAWPVSWDVDFKLYVTGGIIQGIWENGQLKSLKVSPQKLMEKIRFNEGFAYKNVK